ncbi:hypothetical protein [Intrasporangium sp.]|uniref:hypothetical protein n=1 Tax=Intrasporangium sp. TaxID=1925024 RepID=UPI00336592D4
MPSIGMPLSSLRPSARSQASRGWATSSQLRLAALALGATAVTALVCLLAMYAGVPAAGMVNDWLNGAFGWLALGLAMLVWREQSSGWRGDLGLLAAALGALLMTWGSWLVITDTTGYVLAGLVSTLGVAAIGAWLLLVQKAPRPGAGRLGLAAGAVMVSGVLALPGVLQGTDDYSGAPWHVYVAGVAWVGAYVLLPAWCRALRAGLLRLDQSEPTAASASPTAVRR